MKHLGMGLCLGALLALGIAPAASASAMKWLACVEGVEKASPTKYKTNQCNEAAEGGAGKWQWGAVAGTDTVVIKNLTLTLTDTKTPSEATSVRCTVEQEGAGTVSSEGKGTITEAKVRNPKTSCVRLSGECKAGEVEKVAGVHLPWQTEAFETEVGKERLALTKIAADGAGEPGWEFACNTLLGKKTDTCESEGKNTYEQLILLSRFSGDPTRLLRVGLAAHLHKAKCSEGGAEAGELNTPLTITFASEAALELDS